MKPGVWCPAYDSKTDSRATTAPGGILHPIWRVAGGSKTNNLPNRDYEYFKHPRVTKYLM